MQNTLHFLADMPDTKTLFLGQYNLTLVAISIAIAICSSYAALQVCEQVRLSENRRWRFIWLMLGASSLGTGIWAMHFVGMLAFHLPCHVNYDAGETLLSVLPSILASGVALHFCSRASLSIGQLILGGLFVGSGIGTMHYAGMAAMRMDALLVYDPRLFGLSILVAVGLAILALWIKFGLDRWKNIAKWLNLLASIVMGSAIAGMHYTAMAAANFFQLPSLTGQNAGIDLDLIVIVIVTISALITMLMILATFAHRYYVTSKALEKSQQVISNDRLFLENILEAVSDPIFVKNRQHYFIMINEACCKLLRRARAELIGKTDLELFPKTVADRYYQIDENIFITGQSQVNEETYLTEDGLLRHIQTKTTPYYSAVGESLLVGVVRDVTREKETLAALEQARRSAEQTAQMKTMFLANMSHEIRTPMSAVIGLAKLVLTKQLPTDIRDYLEKIKTSSDSLLTILNDILDYSKVETGHMEIAPHLFDLHEVVQNLHNFFAIRATDKNLSLTMTVSSSVPSILIGDSLRIQQVLTNLLGNAVKFTAEGTVSLAITLLKTVENQVTLLFRVADTGIGMSAHDESRLFQAFTQLDNSITRRFGGTGLGLVISSNLLALMGSRFQVESQLNQGSVFSFELCLAVPSAQERENFEQNQRQRRAETAAQLSAHPLKPLTGLSILVAEDNKLNQQVVREFLELSGAEVEMAENGQEALVCLDKAVFDAVLMDMHMPVMSGEEATRHIRSQARFASLPVIALSAGVTSEERGRCLAVGMNDFISKPIMPEELTKTLLHWIKPTSTQEPIAPLPKVSTSPLNLPGFELDNLLKMLHGNKPMVVKLLLKFKQNHADTVQMLKSQLAASEYEQAKQMLHTLKGVAGNLGATTLFTAIIPLENECAIEKIHPNTLENFIAEFARIMASLDTLAPL